MIKRLGLITFIALLLTITACSSNQNNANNEELTIKTTLYPLEYIINEIGDNHVQVETIYPPGVDAHTYEPTSKEITDLAKADAFVYLGAGMEGFANKAANSLETQNLDLIEIGKHDSLFSEGSNTEHEHDDHGDFDPHVWLDPLRMNKMADILLEELITLAPEHEADFKENSRIFKEEMITLNEDFKTTLQDKKNNQILVTHAAYGYWEEKYNIEQLSISGLSTSDEPSQKQLADIARLAKELEIDYVIYSQNDTNKTAEIIQEHIGAQKLQLHDLEVLTEEDIKADADYLSLMENNLAVLDKATD